MARWSWEFRPEVERDFAKLDLSIRKRIIAKLNWFSEHFEQASPLALHYGWKEFCKLRIGEWRIVYKIQWHHRMITVYYIDNRDKIYKKRK